MCLFGYFETCVFEIRDSKAACRVRKQQKANQYNGSTCHQLTNPERRGQAGDGTGGKAVPQWRHSVPRIKNGKKGLELLEVKMG